jgi:hypothetical protein
MSNIFNDNLNPSCQAWLLLAFPGGTEDDALRMFEADTVDQQASDAGVFRIALAGPAYEGVAVLARGLLGPAPVLASGGALTARVFETIFWEEPGAAVDPRKWSVRTVGCSRAVRMQCDQLLPMFLVHISAALHSDLQGKVKRLEQQNSYLQSKRTIRSHYHSITDRDR